MNRDISDALEQIGRGREVNMEVLKETLSKALTSASRKILNNQYDIKVDTDEVTGAFKVSYHKTVVDKVANPDYEVSLKDARSQGYEGEVGGLMDFPVPLDRFGRIAAQITKQVISKKVRDIERDAIFSEFEEKLNTILNGIVLRKENKNILVDLGDTEGIVPIKEQVFRENWQIGDKIKAYVSEVRKTSKGPQVVLSRIHPNFIKKLFEMEIPEIGEGKVEIKAIARDPGYRIKIAVFSEDRNIDSVGACVGIKGGRIQPVVKELKGEKIDVVEWNSDIKTFTNNALRPAKITNILVNETDQSIVVTVPDDQLAIAIGKNGQSAKLAAKLVGWKIDVRSETSFAASGAENVKIIEDKRKEEEQDPFEFMGLNKKVMDKLKTNGFSTKDDFKNATIESLLKINGLTAKTAEKIMEHVKTLKVQENTKTNEQI
ncbi:MAG: transcription termination factor NusA [Candidatus Firestonebacteria bacterium RIFOXYC2_FULL_39_67]|nr:MAG: transcription termination factor NusA [Candidatus Firestonebacteria bacterium RIFOXYD2_FULL_39_29]OGF52216.1 MAG: transcription termination factor NusA [Candidatus Firestonebacteria bacterium RifOxyC12_full_39_7]OGF54084.1 MAG: transcription termination factor NusA [Candidatus Firestonebacteria bacterium RIFOXYC2_FULL_39_67]